MASNLNTSIRSSNSSTHSSSKDTEDYLPDSLKHVFAEARKQIEKATSEEDDNVDKRNVDDTTGERSHDKKVDTSVLTDLSGYSLDRYNNTSMLSPESDIAGPFDTAMGSACRRNPADLYKTTAEAREQALDDKPGVCPDHEDDCQCHLRSVFPVFNLEAALNGGKNDRIVKQNNNDSSFPKVNEDERGEEATLGEDHQDSSSPNSIRDFLPQDDGPFVDRDFSQDTDLSFHDEDDDVGPLEYSPNDNRSSDQEEDILDFLPNDDRNTLSRVVHDDTVQLPGYRNEKRNKSSSNVISTKDVTKQTPSRRGFLGKNRVSKGQEELGKKSGMWKRNKEPTHRVFNISMPKSPRIRRSQRSIQYQSVDDPMAKTSRMDVPLTIELRGDKFTGKSSKVNTITPPRKKEEKKKRLTIPKTPKLLTKQKWGDRRYSTVGPSKEKEDDDGMKQSLLVGTKRTLTIPKEPRLFSKEKLGERKYSSIGREAKERETVGFVESIAPSRPRPLTRPKSPALVLTEKFGERRYSTVSRSDTNYEEKKGKKESVAMVPKPTVPKTPRLSFFIRKANKIAKDTLHDDGVPKVQKEEFNSFHKGSKRVSSYRPLTVPQPFHLATDDRAHSPRRSKNQLKDCRDSSSCTKESISIEEDRKGYVFRARPVPDFSRTMLVSAQSKPPARPLTVPQPFNLATNDRAHSPRRSKKECTDSVNHEKEGSESGEDRKGYVFRARPVPDFSRTMLVSSQSKPPARPLTVPQPFNLATNDRAHSRQRSKKECTDGVNHEQDGADIGGDRMGYVFRARPVPDFSRNMLVSAQSKPPARPLTVPQPFHLATNDRAHSPRRSKKECTDGVNHEKEGSESGEDRKGYVFRARPVPDFSRNMLVSAQSKPPARPLTVPQPFNLATSQRPPVRHHFASMNVDTDAIDDKYVSSSRKVPNFSRNPNTHRVALVKRASIGKFPFRTLNNCHTAESIYSSQVASKSSPVAEGVFDENHCLPHEGLSSLIPHQQHKTQHDDLRQKLSTRSKQNAVSRAEQYDQTLNMVNRFIENNSCLLSSSATM
jgi:hypothetical protein